MPRHIFKLKPKFEAIARDLYARRVLRSHSLTELGEFLREREPDFVKKPGYERLKKAWQDDDCISGPLEKAIGRLALIDLGAVAWYDPSNRDNEGVPLDRDARGNVVNRGDDIDAFEYYLENRPFVPGITAAFDRPLSTNRDIATFSLDTHSNRSSGDNDVPLLLQIVVKEGRRKNEKSGFTSVRLSFAGATGDITFASLMGYEVPVTVNGARFRSWGSRFDPEWFLENDEVHLHGSYDIDGVICQISGATEGDSTEAILAANKADFVVIDENGTLADNKRKERVLALLEFKRSYGDVIDADKGWVKLGAQTVRIVAKEQK